MLTTLSPSTSPSRVKERPELKPRFFDLKGGAPPDTPNVNILAMLLAGYPAADQVYEVHENNHIGLARRHVVCLPDGQPQDEALLRVRAVRPLEVDPDGMSGGSAFVVLLDHGEPKAYFAGIIVRGGREYFHILKAGYVIAFLRSFALMPPVAGGPILHQQPGDVGLGPSL